MGRIHILDENTINHIAAGEVVERPASVAKELVENAIDAMADRITVEIKEGGIGMLRVTDNGLGFLKEDIRNAFLRHATSKIKDTSDLVGIHSLGFRGEALASIAAVSQVELMTKPQDALVGCRYVIEGGSEKIFQDIATPDGTTFIARNLFFNTPARRKFLKSSRAEASAVSDIIERLALSRPEISFRLIVDSKQRLHTTGSGKLKEAILQIYGIQYARDLIAIDFRDDDDKLHVSGYLGKPSLGRGNRSYEHFFLHGRYIKSTLLEKAVEDAVAPQMMTGRFPFCVLHLDNDLETVDVNVHPSKMEVRFHEEQAVYEKLHRGVKYAATHSEQIPVVTEKPEEVVIPRTAPASQPVSEPLSKPLLEPDPDVFVPISFEKKVETKPVETVREKQDYLQGEQIEYKKDLFLDKKAAAFHKIIGQLFDTYWIVELEDKYYMIDQHAAHEKVLYEEMLNKLGEKVGYGQRLLEPVVVTLTSSEYERYISHEKLFEDLGYKVEPFGTKDLIIKSVPYIFDKTIGEEDFILILDRLSDVYMSDKYERLLHDIASMSCKAAIKANDRLSELEYRHLIDRLMALEDPFHCPHGRPVIISMTKYDLEKKFKRIV